MRYRDHMFVLLHHEELALANRIALIVAATLEGALDASWAYETHKASAARETAAGVYQATKWLFRTDARLHADPVVRSGMESAGGLMNWLAGFQELVIGHLEQDERECDSDRTFEPVATALEELCSYCDLKPSQMGSVQGARSMRRAAYRLSEALHQVQLEVLSELIRTA